MILQLAHSLAFIFQKVECTIGHVHKVGLWPRFILNFFYENHTQSPAAKGTHQ